MRKLEEIARFLKEHKAELREKFKVEELGIFGSTARGEDKEGSDLDLLVDFLDGADLFDLVRLAAFIEENTGRRVDIVPIRTLRGEFRNSVLKETVVI